MTLFSVKSLEWETDPNFHRVAKSAVGTYRTWNAKDGYYWSKSEQTKGTFAGTHAEDAQIAAQSDFEALIQRQIEPARWGSADIGIEGL